MQSLPYLLRLFGRIYRRNGCSQNRIKRENQSIQTALNTTRASNIKSCETYTSLWKRLFETIPVSLDGII